MSLYFKDMQPTARILLYTATDGYRHDSIPDAIEELQRVGSAYHVEFDATEDRTVFTEENLTRYDAIMWVSSIGEILDETGKDAFRAYLSKGGNFIAVHCATYCLVKDKWFKDLVGAYFDYHPPLQTASIDVLDASHPSTSMLPLKWEVYDEMYNFKSDPRSVGAVVVLSADESSYIDEGERKFDHGSPHPIAWYQERAAVVDAAHSPGRTFYTSLGHTKEIWKDTLFIRHVMGGVTWALQSKDYQGLH